MAGVSVQAFRRQGRRFGAGLVCSEMVSACGLSYGNARTLGYLRIARDEHPLAVQVFGSDPATVADAARMCEAAGADIIDINFGCPVRKVTKTGAGASALDNHEVAIALTRAVADAVTRARDRQAARRRAQRLSRLPRARPQARRRRRPGHHAAPALRAADVHRPRRPPPDGRARRARRHPRDGLGRHHDPRACAGGARFDRRERGHDRARRPGRPVAPGRARGRRAPRADRRRARRRAACASCARSHAR